MNKTTITTEQRAFIERVGIIASKGMAKSGILASLTLAQAILESGWGKSGLTACANALFGIKAGQSWAGKVYSAQTKECYDGVTYTTITALFKAYESWEDSIADHTALLTGLPRYAAVVGERDYKAACKAVQAAGYATDPGYADKLIALIEGYALTDWDAQAPDSPAVAAFAKGDRVKLTGYLYGDSYGGKQGFLCKNTTHTITRVADTKRAAPYLLDEVLGWARGKDLSRAGAPPAALAVTAGDKVKVKPGASDYDGKALKRFVYKNTYVVFEVSGNRVVIGIGRSVTAAMRAEDLTPA